MTLNRFSFRHSCFWIPGILTIQSITFCTAVFSFINVNIINKKLIPSYNGIISKTCQLVLMLYSVKKLHTVTVVRPK